MRKLTIDTGMMELEVNGNGLLRFNPSDPNLYDRFAKALDKVTTIENGLVEKAKALPHGESNGVQVVNLMAEADMEVKRLLQEVFGQENDFDQLLGGLNLMAVATNGERVITNLLDALRPIIEDGTKNFYNERANKAVAEAKANREQRRAASHKK